MAIQRDPLDPKGLIREAYRIDGIGPGECRSIFLDWALSQPQEGNPQVAISALIDHYAPDNPDHPMTRVLREGMETSGPARRRGGWRSRPRDM